MADASSSSMPGQMFAAMACTAARVRALVSSWAASEKPGPGGLQGRGNRHICDHNRRVGRELRGGASLPGRIVSKGE